MPELPEVETSCRGIRPFVEKQIIQAIDVYQAKLRYPVPTEQLHKLQGQTIEQVTRRAKYIQLHCAEGYLLVHLGMSGHLRIVPWQEPWQKHVHVDIKLGNGYVLRFTDPRKFGLVVYQAYQDGEHPLLSHLGPEPLTQSFNAEYLYRQAKGKKQAIKSFLMDNQVVVGVGNIYAAEALFKAGIAPKRAAGNISFRRVQQLVDAVKTILALSIEQGGSSLKDFLHSDGKPGYFQQTLQVYGREGLPCRVCGHAIKRIKLGQRSSFYCSHCQK